MTNEGEQTLGGKILMCCLNKAIKFAPTQTKQQRQYQRDDHTARKSDFNLLKFCQRIVAE